MIGLIVFGALLPSMTDVFTVIAADTTNYSDAARSLATAGPLFLVLGVVGLAIALGVYALTRYI